MDTLHEVRSTPPARLALHVYAGVTGVFGLFLFMWGPVWFGHDVAPSANPFVGAAIVRIGGAVMIALSMAAMGLAANPDPVAMSRGINWFTGAHLVLWVIIDFQRETVLGPGLAWDANIVAIVLLFGLACIREGSGAAARQRGGSVAAALTAHSRYDQAIRDAASQEERHRLARDLHDSIKQQIFAIQTAAATAETRLEHDRTGVGDALALVRGSAREAMTEMEAMLDQLRAAPLDNAGLIAALRKQCDAVGFRTDATVTFTADTLPPDETLGPGVRPAILRIAQEALANIARHARARHVTVTLATRVETRGGRAMPNGLDLIVADDGRGFDPGDSSTTSSGMGLRNMQSRAADVDGIVTFTARPGDGATIRASIPGMIAASTERNPQWNPWTSNVLPWAIAFLIGSIWPHTWLIVMGVFAALVLLREWLNYRARRRGPA